MQLVTKTAEDTFAAGRSLGEGLTAGDIVLLYGGLGAGKTLFTKGILEALGYDIDEVTSPSFTLVNLYKTPNADVYHIDLWRIDNDPDPSGSVGLDEILENDNAIVIIEWAGHLGDRSFPVEPYRISISGDGDEPRDIDIQKAS